MSSEKKSYNFDFSTIKSLVLENRKIYLVIIIISLILGVVVSFSIPKSYTTKIMLAPENSSESSLSSSLSSLTSLMGINMGGIMSTDAIFPDIYPDVVKSTDFLVELSKIPVESRDKKVSTTLYSYMENHQKSPWWISMFKSFFKKKDTSKNLNALHLTKKQGNVIENIGDNISCNVTKDNGVIIIKATAQDPLISMTIADSVSSRLQDFIINYRTNKARNDLAHIQKLYKEAKNRYDKARQVYSTFADSNQDLVLTAFKAKEDDLENEMQLQYNIYSQVAMQLQMARAKVIEKTPVYAVLQAASIPYRHSSPKRLFIIFAFFLVGIFVYTAYLMFKN